MTNPNPFMFPQFDPSKMDPKVLMQLSQLIQQLPREKLNEMQTLMHNTMAGLDVRREMEEFEKSLPPGFREKLMSLMAGQMGATGASSPAVVDAEYEPVGSSQAPSPGLSTDTSGEMNIREARLTILKAVAAGQIPPEEAEKLLFTA
jgi:hypothetical protein